MRRSLIFALLLAATACDKGTTVDDTTTPQDTAPEERDGETLYTTYCSGCHGADGSGGTEEGILGELHHSDEQIVSVILNGHGEMAPVAVTEEEAQRIVDYIRETF